MARVASRCLAIFTHALNVQVLRAYARGPLAPGELEKTLAWAAESSLRGAVRNLEKAGALSHPDGSATELSDAGQQLLLVADALERWLGEAPDPPGPLEGAAAQGLLKALLSGWEAGMVRPLAERPLTLLELDREVPALNYPAVKRRLAKLRATKLVARSPGEGSAAYVAGDWLRAASLPLALAARWEAQNAEDCAPLSGADVEAAFLLALPLARLPLRASGSCALATLVAGRPGRAKRRVAGVTVEVEKGAIVSLAPSASNRPTWALGTPEAWLAAVLDGTDVGLRLGGANPRLVKGIVAALHATASAGSRARA